MAPRLLALALLLAVAAPRGAPAGDTRLVVIVHPDRRIALDPEDVARIYLRRQRFWEDGAPVVPINLPSGSALRERFSRRVLRQSESRLAEYWNRRYFDGVLPPPTLASTEAVRRYVADDRNAVGYVPETELDGTVRVLFPVE